MKKAKPQDKYAWTVKIGEKGQIVIPKQARELFGFQPGDTILLMGDIHRGLAIPPQSMFTKIASAVFAEGVLKEEEEE